MTAPDGYCCNAAAVLVAVRAALDAGDTGGAIRLVWDATPEADGRC